MALGGLGESATFAEAEAGMEGSAPGVASGSERRGDGGVAHAEVLYRASEAEQVLQLLLQHLKSLQKLSPGQGDSLYLTLQPNLSSSMTIYIAESRIPRMPKR